MAATSATNTLSHIDQNVAVKGPCNLNCIFCNPTGLAPSRKQPIASVIRAIDAVADNGLEHISFGIYNFEPTTHPDFEKAVAHARDRGFKSILVSTSGVLTARRDYLERLRDAGLTGVSVTFFSADEQRSALISGRAGCLKAKLETIRNCAALGIDRYMQMLVMSVNIDEIPSILTLLNENSAGKGLRVFSIAALHPSSSEKSKMLLTPHAATLMKKLASIDTKGLHEKIHVYGAPRCVFDRFLGGAESVFVHTESPEHLNHKAKRLPACEGCAHSAGCPGVKKYYLDRFGDAEFSAEAGEIESPPDVSIEHVAKQQYFDLGGGRSDCGLRCRCGKIITQMKKAGHLMNGWIISPPKSVSAKRMDIQFVNRSTGEAIILLVAAKDGPENLGLDSKSCQLNYQLMGTQGSDTVEKAEALIRIFRKFDSLLG